MAVSRGSRSSPRCTMSLFLPESDTCLSATMRSADLYFSSLYLLQSDNFKLPFSMFNTDSLMQFTRSLFQLVEGFTQIRFGRLEHLKGVVIRLHTLRRLYQSTRLEDIQPGICWFETADRLPCLVSDPKLGSRGVFVSHPCKRYTAREYLRVTINWPSRRTVPYL